MMELSEVHHILETAPALKARAAEIQVNALADMEQAELDYKRARSEKYKTLVNREGLTPHIIKGILDGDAELIELEQKVSAFKQQAKIAEKELSYQDDRFTSAKIIARLKMAELGGGLEDARN